MLIPSFANLPTRKTRALSDSLLMTLYSKPDVPYCQSSIPLQKVATLDKSSLLRRLMALVSIAAIVNFSA